MAKRIAVSTLVISVLMIGAVPVTATAADIPVDVGTQSLEPSFDPVQASSIWNGVYGGLYGGLNWQSIGVMGSSDIDLDKAKEGGAYIGINQALGSSIVGGFEWMGGYSGESDSAGGISVQQDWETSLRARMGYAFEQNLVYGLAGVSATQLEASQGGDTDRNWLTGWTVGAGIERQFADGISGRIEYDYSHYGEKEFDLGTGPAGIDLNGHGVKVGVGVKF